MRLLSLSLSSTSRGWHGKGPIWQPTLAGCTGWKFVIHPMSWLLAQILTCFPALPKMPCCVENCQRCAAHFGGFKFPWLGLWNSRGIVLPPDMAPNEAWGYFYRHQERMDLLLVAAYTNFTPAPDLVPQELYGLQLRCSAGDAGQLGLGEIFDQWRTWLDSIGSRGLLVRFVEPRIYPRAPRRRPWPAWGLAGSRAHRALCGWLESQTWRQPCGHCGERRKMLSDV